MQIYDVQGIYSRLKTIEDGLNLIEQGDADLQPDDIVLSILDAKDFVK